MKVRTARQILKQSYAGRAYRQSTYDRARFIFYRWLKRRQPITYQLASLEATLNNFGFELGEVRVFEGDVNQFKMGSGFTVTPEITAP